jgi:hypothetical protein
VFVQVETVCCEFGCGTTGFTRYIAGFRAATHAQATVAGNNLPTQAARWGDSRHFSFGLAGDRLTSGTALQISAAPVPTAHAGTMWGVSSHPSGACY